MDQDKIIATVQRLISKNGRGVTLQRLEGAVDPAKPWRGAATPVAAFSVQAVGVFLPASGEAFGQAIVSMDLLARADEVLMVAPVAGQDYTTINQIVDRTLTWAVQWVHALQPSDKVLLYAMGVKR
jgi:hypothetical protein